MARITGSKEISLILDEDLTANSTTTLLYDRELGLLVTKEVRAHPAST